MTTKRERILALADGTRTAREIAELTGATPGSVRTVLWAEGLVGQLKFAEQCRCKPERDRAIMVLWQLGETQTEIAARFNLHNSRVCQIISRGID